MRVFRYFSESPRNLLVRPSFHIRPVPNTNYLAKPTSIHFVQIVDSVVYYIENIRFSRYYFHSGSSLSWDTGSATMSLLLNVHTGTRFLTPCPPGTRFLTPCPFTFLLLLLVLLFLSQVLLVHLIQFDSVPFWNQCCFQWLYLSHQYIYSRQGHPMPYNV